MFRRPARPSGDPPGHPPLASGLRPPEARFAARRTCRRSSVAVWCCTRVLRDEKDKAHAPQTSIAQSWATGNNVLFRRENKRCKRIMMSVVFGLRGGSRSGCTTRQYTKTYTTGAAFQTVHVTKHQVLRNASNWHSECTQIVAKSAGHLCPRLVESGVADTVEPVREAGCPVLIPVAQQPGAALVGEHKVEAGVPPPLLFSSGVSRGVHQACWEGVGRTGDKTAVNTAKVNGLCIPRLASPQRGRDV